MADFNIIKVEGKPLEKLITVISKGLGKLYKPKEIKKNADAKAYEIKVIERAKTKAKIADQKSQFELDQKIEDRLLHKEAQRQKNIDSINYVAAEQVSMMHSVSSESVDQDWITRFFNIAQDISNEEMQKLWGRILAGEVESPGSYSMRTLEIMKNMSSNEAKIFSKIAKLSVYTTGRCFLIKLHDSEYYEKEHDIAFLDLLTLREIGLISPDDAAIQFHKTKAGQDSLFKYGNSGISLERTQDGSNIKISVIPLTISGKELAELVDVEYDSTFLKKIYETYTAHDRTLIMKKGEVFKDETGEWCIKDLKQIEF